MDVNETYQSAQNDVAFGAVYGNVLLNNAQGAHVSHRYIPGKDNAIWETRISFNDGSLAETLVGRAVGPRIRGDAVLTACAASGAAAGTYDIDNLVVRRLACPTAPLGVVIDGPDEARIGEAVELHVEAPGAERPLSYTWSVLSGDASITPSGASATLTGNSGGEAEIQVVADDDCGASGSAKHRIKIFTGRNQKPNDENQDGRFDISDPVSVLNHLFLGTNPAMPCGDGTIGQPANIALLDCGGDGKIDLSDAVCMLAFLFLAGPLPATCRRDPECGCVLIVDCADSFLCP